MSTKIDYAELKAAYEAYRGDANKVGKQAQIAAGALGRLRNGGLEGNTADAISAEVNNQLTPILDGLNDVTQLIRNQFTNALSGFRTTVRESSNTAVIDNDAIATLESSIAAKLRDKTKIDTGFQTTYTDIDDLLTLSMPVPGEFYAQANDAKEVLSNTETWLEEFEATSSGRMKKITSAVTQIQAQLRLMNQGSGMSYSNPKFLALLNNSSFSLAMSHLSEYALDDSVNTANTELKLLGSFKKQKKAKRANLAWVFESFSYKAFADVMSLSASPAKHEWFVKMMKETPVLKKAFEWSITKRLAASYASFISKDGKVWNGVKFVFDRFNHIVKPLMTGDIADLIKGSSKEGKKFLPFLWKGVKAEGKDVVGGATGGVFKDFAFLFVINATADGVTHPKQNTAKMIWGGAVDAVSDSGPIMGAEAGAIAGGAALANAGPGAATFGTLAGAGAGFLGGGYNIVADLFFPSQKKIFYQWLKQSGYNFIDQGDIQKFYRDHPKEASRIANARAKVEKATGYRDPLASPTPVTPTAPPEQYSPYGH